MGRAKLDMEFIDKEKKRVTTFKKRKYGLIKKIQEFTTLCDVSACMIIYGPDQESGRSEPDIWPENPDEVKRIIDVYRAKNWDMGDRTYSVTDFFLDRKRKVEDELKKMRRKNMEAKYPTWPNVMNQMSEPEMRVFAANLSAKLEKVRATIDQIRLIQQGHQQNIITSIIGGDYYNNTPHTMHMPNYYPTVDNSTMMHLTNVEYNNDNNFNKDTGNFLCGLPSYDQQLTVYNQTNPSIGWEEQQMPIVPYYGPGLQPVPYCLGPGMQFLQPEGSSGHDQMSVNSGQCDRMDYNDNK